MMQERLESMIKETMCKDHTGREFYSISEMCRAWNVPRSTFENRISKGNSIEECLTGSCKDNRKKERVKDHTGREFSCASEMCKAWGTNISNYYYRLHRGYSLEESLTGDFSSIRISPKGKRGCVDHNGKRYDTITNMCKQYGITSTAFSKRLSRGYTLEQALTGNIKGIQDKRKIHCKDHKGNEFESVTAMCKHWGVKIYTFKYRYNRNNSIKYCLTGKK